MIRLRRARDFLSTVLSNSEHLDAVLIGLPGTRFNFQYAITLMSVLKHESQKQG
jgi:hypothetical protein